MRIKGQQRWITIGEHGSPWAPEQARKEAQRLWGEIHSGVDVAALRQTGESQRAMEALCARYLAEHAREKKKLLSIRADERNIRNHVFP